MYAKCIDLRVHLKMHTFGAKLAALYADEAQCKNSPIHKDQP